MVLADINTRADAIARRSVTDFSVVSTIFARPCSSMWVSSLIVSKKNLNAKGRKGLRKRGEGRLEFVNYSSYSMFHVNQLMVWYEPATKDASSHSNHPRSSAESIFIAHPTTTR